MPSTYSEVLKSFTQKGCKNFSLEELFTLITMHQLHLHFLPMVRIYLLKEAAFRATKLVILTNLLFRCWLYVRHRGIYRNSF